MSRVLFMVEWNSGLSERGHSASGWVKRSAISYEIILDLFVFTLIVEELEETITTLNAEGKLEILAPTGKNF